MLNSRGRLRLSARALLSIVAVLLASEALSVAGVVPENLRVMLPAERLVERFVNAGVTPQARENDLAGSSRPIPSQARILIRSLDIASPLVFPTVTDLETLRQALNRGVVHYPLSAFPHEAQGNVFLFGHSSSRPFEQNPARTVFTRLAELEPGAEIELWYRDRVYLYRVNTVKILKPWEAEVYFDIEKRMLTLSTCWPIGDPTNRFVVEAEFMRSYPLPSLSSAVGTSS